VGVVVVGAWLLAPPGGSLGPEHELIVATTITSAARAAF